MKKIIYDIGANNGDDIPYYLMRADLVVAVEANPVLCQGIKERFPDEIALGQLVIENCVVDVNPGRASVPFYIHRGNHVLSQFPRPEDQFMHEFLKVNLPSKSILEIITSHGEPYYVKVDIEHFDHALLRAMFENDIRPPYVSAESHSSEVFAILVALGGYKSFKVVDGGSVQFKYGNVQLETQEGGVNYNFPAHSAGPFGNDILGDWMTPDILFGALGIAGLGWRDIHASRYDEANPGFVPGRHLQVVVNF